MTETKISLVVPAYNAAKHLAQSLALLCEYLNKTFSDWEIVVVDDGSTDNTWEILQAGHFLHVSTLRLAKNQGKFAALKAGVQAARGSCIIFTDSDLPFDLEALPYIEKLINSRGWQMVIGDRSLKESLYGKKLSPWRRITTLACRTMVRIFLTGEIFDTQCGLKGFRSDVAKAIFPLLKEQRFAGDIELIYLALKYNLEVRRIPVRLRRAQPSTVFVIPTALQIMGRVLRLPFSWFSGRYHSADLERLSNQCYWEASNQQK